MPAQNEILQIYRELADWYERHHQAQMRDRFLVLAADAAVSAGQSQEAERLRQRLLGLNPHHLLRPYQSMTQALQAPDVQTYVRDLRLNYPLETVRELLRNVRAGEGGGGGSGPDIELNLVDESTFREPAPGLDETAALPSPRQQPARPAAPAPGQPAKPQAAPRRGADLDIDHTARPSGPAPASRPRSPQHEVNETANLPASPAAPRGRQPAPVPAARPQAAAPAQQQAQAAAPAPRPTAPVRTSTPPASPPEPLDGGGWLSVSLFVLVVAAGIALAGYALARPFLPLP